MAKIVYCGTARGDMVDIWVWIAQNNSEAVADKIIHRIEKRISMLETTAIWVRRAPIFQNQQGFWSLNDGWFSILQIRISFGSSES